MATKILTLPFIFSTLLISLHLHFASGQTVVKGSYWVPNGGLAVSDIHSTLFTHLYCAFANVDDQTYKVTIPSSNQAQFSTFTQTVQKKNPSVKTLLSIDGGGANDTTFALMASQSKTRKTFIDSSIAAAKKNNFHGLDIVWNYPSDTIRMSKFGKLLKELRAAVAAEAKNSGKSPLLLSAVVLYVPYYFKPDLPYPIQELSNSLDWINIHAFDFYSPGRVPTSTRPPAALYNPGNGDSGAYGVQSWIQSGMPAKKMVFGLPFYGWSWRLTNANNHGLFAPANRAAVSGDGGDGSLGYKEIKQFITQNSATKVFDSTLVADYCYSGTTWIGYDDIQSISTKVSYAKGKGLLGYNAWHVGADDNWTLSTKAFQTWG